MNLSTKYASLCIIGLFSLSFTQSCSLLRKKSNKKESAEMDSKMKRRKDSLDKAKDEPIKAFSAVIKDKNIKPQIGLFKVYDVKGKWYFEIPDSILNRDILITTRIDQAPYELKVPNMEYGGEKIDQTVWKFRKNKKRVDVIIPNFKIVSDSTKDMYQAVRNSNSDNISESFPIECYNKDTTGVLIEVTSILGDDNEPFSLNEGMKTQAKLGGFDKKKSNLDTIIAYKNNIEVSSVKTFTATKREGNSLTFKLHSSFLLLPKLAVKPRYADGRVGFFGQRVVDFDQNPEGVDDYGYIHRWSLIPKDTAAYLRGELVEPVKQIVIYIDPATPKKWVPYLIQGINDWNVAFEAAGFKNAIVGKAAPTPAQDSAFNVNDSRYSVLRYLASATQNAYGPHTSDPRTGEIIETHIGWYHNVMELLHNWYRTQTAAANPKSRPQTLPTEEMGQLIRFVSSHEVGHTLGLMHNFGSSYAYTPEQLRSKSFTDSHGTAPSIMDYARFNYIAQPGDGITNFFPRIGTYDKWAVKWGYTWFPDSYSADKEKEILNKWMLSHAGDPEYYYGEQGSPDDPRKQSEDLSNDAMKASMLGIANLKVILPQLPNWTFEAGKTYDENLKSAFDNVVGQFNRYCNHVMSNIGGSYNTILMYGQNGENEKIVPKNIQQNALKFLNEQAFNYPTWMVNKDIVSKISYDYVNSKLSPVPSALLSKLMYGKRLENLLEAERQEGKNAFTVQDLLAGLRGNIFGKANADDYKRILQRVYVNNLEKLITEENSSSDVKPLARYELQQLLPKMGSLAKSSSGILKAHYSDLELRIKKALKADEQSSEKLPGLSFSFPKADGAEPANTSDFILNF